jgi:hypothetical protein
MIYRSISRLIGFIFFSFCSCTYADEFEIGRTNLILPGSEWKVLDESSGPLKHSHGSLLDVKTQSKVLYKLNQQGSLQTIVFISSTVNNMGGNGTMSYNNECKSTEQTFAQGLSGPRLNSLECLRVSPTFQARELLEKFSPETLDKFTSNSVTLPEQMNYIVSSSGLSTGAQIHMEILNASDFLGTEYSGNDEIPTPVAIGHVAWGQLLMAEVRSSLRSFSGNLVLPSLKFSQKQSSAQSIAAIAD